MSQASLKSNPSSPQRVKVNDIVTVLLSHWFLVVLFACHLALSLEGALYSELLICLKGGGGVALGRK